MSGAKPRVFKLLKASALGEGAARGFRVSGLEVVVVRKGGAVSAFENRCPHRGVSLDWAPDRFWSDDGSHLQCATHGALFEPNTGACVAGPCVGRGLARLALVERDEYLCVEIPAGTTRGEGE